MNSKFCSYDPVTKIWSGQRRQPIYNTEINLGYLLLHKLAQNPQHIGQISADTGVKLTNSEMYERSIKFAKNFMDLQLKQGHVVGLIASNSENLALIIIGCLVLGIAVNPLSVVMDEDDIAYMWSKTKPKVVFSDGNIVEKVKKAVEKIGLDAKIYTMMKKVDGFPYADELLNMDYDVNKFEFPDLPNISSTTAIIGCSSGTTDSPKGICKSHKQFIAHSILMPNYKSSDILFNSIPSYWTLYMSYLRTCIFYDITSVITTQHIEPDMWMDIIDRYNVTLVFSSARFAAILLDSKNVRKLSTVRTVTMGGSAFTEEIVNNFRKIFPNGRLVMGYGSTEGDTVTFSAIGGEIFKTSSGYPFYNTQIKIVDENGHALGPNQTGEIYYKTAVLFTGYFGDPQAYADSFDADGFLKSGDLGYFDGSGQIFVLDRISHMIKSIGSHKVTPTEVERYINEIPGVVQSCVVGAFDEDLFYDRICAFVIRDKKSDELTEEFIIDYVNSRVINEKKITGGVHFVDKFPMTDSGKVKNRELKKIANEILKSRKCAKIKEN